MRVIVTALSVVASFSVLVGCGEADQGESPEGAATQATLQLSLSGADFSGHSVQVRGTRVDASGQPLPSSSQYRCDNSFDRCFNLSGLSPTLTVKGLCPSSNHPQNGYWTFEYALHTSGCSSNQATGERLNDPVNNRYNFQCFDSEDVYTRAHANRTWLDRVQPGNNQNSVVCMTTNGSNTVGFSSCAVESETTTELVLDCGCTASAGTCDCGALTDGASGNLQSDTTGRCVIDPSAPTPCSIVCCATGLTACRGGCIAGPCTP